MTSDNNLNVEKNKVDVSKNVPELRFQGFTDAWELRKFSDLVVRLNKASNNNQLPKVEFEDIIAGEGRLNKDISHKFDDRKGILFEPQNILYGKLRPYLKNWLIADFKGIALGDFWVFKAIKSEPKFIYSLIQANNYQRVANDTSGTKMPRSDWKKISSSYFSIPQSTEEQEKIGNLFKQLDNTVTLHQRKLDKLKRLKKGYLQQLFSKNDDKVPRVRFANFTDEWELRKLDDIAKRVIRKNKDLESTLSLTISAQEGLINQNEFFNKTVASRDVSGYYLVKNGEFAYNKSYSNGYPWGAVKRLNRYNMGVLSTLYIVFEPTNIDSDFLEKYYDTTYWHKEISKHAAEGARNHGLLNIAATDFFKTELVISKSLEEQQKIGSFFQQLDNIITLHQSKLDKLKSIKQSLLQKMFI
ncbi:restriction endonuclease subunit S [Lactococcus lactis subsp. lactis]|uniref:restriction endonuclease subunit S n=1 Tax=Lactococcus lactis TaxID=1358 RepID=UPI00300E2452